MGNPAPTPSRIDDHAQNQHADRRDLASALRGLTVEWLRWVITVAVIGAAYWQGQTTGEATERDRWQQQAIAERDRAIAERDARIATGNEARAAELADLSAMQANLDRIARSTGSIGNQLRSALDASSMGTCLLTDDVRRLRAESYEEARRATAAANAARSAAQ